MNQIELLDSKESFEKRNQIYMPILAFTVQEMFQQIMEFLLKSYKKNLKNMEQDFCIQ